MWAITPKCSSLPRSQDRDEVPYTSINIDLDPYETLNSTQEILTSPVLMTPTNREVKVINTTPSVVTAEFSWRRAYKLSNMEGKLNSKCNDTSSKPIANSLSIFLDFYKSLEETKMLITKKNLVLAVLMHYENQTR